MNIAAIVIGASFEKTLSTFGTVGQFSLTHKPEKIKITPSKVIAVTSTLTFSNTKEHSADNKSPKAKIVSHSISLCKF